MFDWDAISNAVDLKKTCFAYDTHAQYFTKVAMDQFRPKNGGDQLWELRTAEDGKEYLYALYNEPEDVVTGSAQIEWKATAEKDGLGVTLAFKSIPIYRFASDTYKYPVAEANDFASFIEAKAKDSDWRGAFFKSVMSITRQDALNKLIKGA